MRRAAKIDGNQPELVKALRKMGFSVALTHQLGKGFPDAVIGWQDAMGRHNTLVEFKDGSLAPSKRKLTSDEQVFHDEWRGDIVIIESLEDCVAFHRERVK